MKKKCIVLSLVFLAQLYIVAQDGNSKKQVDQKSISKKETVAHEGKLITGKDKVAECEALQKVNATSKTIAPNTKVETVVVKKGKANVKREEATTKVEPDTK